MSHHFAFNVEFHSLRPGSFWNSNRGLNWSSNQFEKLPKKILIKFKGILFFCLQDMIDKERVQWPQLRKLPVKGANGIFGQQVFSHVRAEMSLFKIGKPWNWNEILSGFCRLITGTISLSGLDHCCRRSSELRKIGLGSIQSLNDKYKFKWI